MTTDSKFSIDFSVTGTATDAAAVLALASALGASVSSWSPRAHHKAIVKFDPPGLRQLSLGRMAQAGERRSKLGAAGIFNVDQLCKRTAKQIKEIMGALGLKVIRQALYISDPRRALTDDDPEAFPLLIDSLPVNNSLFPRIAALDITRIDELTAEHVTKFDLARALEIHTEMYGIPHEQVNSSPV